MGTSIWGDSHTHKGGTENPLRSGGKNKQWGGAGEIPNFGTHTQGHTPRKMLIKVVPTFCKKTSFLQMCKMAGT